MPGRLKSFELHGYKTFASSTEFLFADGVTAIVGPNGSGKSNIADALRWVLGEQSFGLLRAKKTEDMIFAGSEHRPRAGMASATIVFDNSDGWLPIDFSEVGITRRAYRDGDNEYLLNGQRVRLKDVSELLAQSGLAERTYTVIGQGLVDAALSLKAEERRRLFEEAAGIGLHRSRRDEALRRLDTTRRNLERVQDILAELQPRLRSLERQSRRAQEYDQARADLKILLREWYGYHWHQAQAELTESKEAARYQEAALGKVREEQANLDKKLATIRSQSQELRNRIRELNLSLSSAYSHREQMTREQAVAEERARSLEKQGGTADAEILRLQEEINFYQEQVNDAGKEIDRLSKDENEAKLNMDEATRALDERRTQVESAEKEHQTARQALSALNTRQSILQTQLAERQRLLTQRQKHLKEISVSLLQAEQDVKLNKTAFQSAIERQKSVDNNLHEAEAALQTNRQAITRLESSRRETLEQQGATQARLTQLQARLEVLRQAEDNLSGYADGARLLLQALRTSRITGARGALSDYIEVPNEYERAIASVLGENLGVVLVDGWAGVEEALEILDDGSARGALLSMDALTPAKPLTIDAKRAPVENDAIIGIASEIVKVKEELRSVVDLLLGQVVIVRDRGTARRLLAKGNWSAVPLLRIVTLKGEVFYSNGTILSASGSEGVLGRPRQRKELEAEINKVSQTLLEFRNTLSELDRNLLSLHNDESVMSQTFQGALEVQKLSATEVGKLELSVEKAQRSLIWQQEQAEGVRTEIQQAEADEAKISNDLKLLENEIQESRVNVREKAELLETLSLDEMQGQLSYWQTQTAVTARALMDAEGNRQGKIETLARAVKSLDALRIRKNEMVSELNDLVEVQGVLSDRFTKLAQEIEDLRALVIPAETELGEVEKILNQWITIDLNARQTLSTAEHQHAQARINLSRRQEILDSLRRRIEDDFGLVAFEYAEAVSGPKPLPLDGMVEELPMVDQISLDLEENVQRQRALLRRMGPVNPDAQTEYQEVKERFEFLTTQVNDLHRAESDILEVIAELDLLMEREFRKTFDAVAQEFRQIFTRLFGGGMAKLVLTDPDDMTETGIDIEARLPGRREQGLSLLSGGERSLTAAALVFALLRISPTPFCILDEVDAMLDEANVGRFRELLLELSENTQFIIITHNRNTVQAASVIYGVTMGRDSASQVIGLKLDELTEEYGVQHS